MEIKHLHKKDLSNLKGYRMRYLALVKLIKSEHSYYDIQFKKHKDIDDFKIAQVLYKIINSENK